ncbi:hypothetical protein VNO78_11557 [Psophocarpus tetragonolobus]|uniref:Uncharacterized protein n=1 Tax=Psophocarpus tetragonolobus TaxID=3891 RepID=A0AAN9SMK2_PSOTE
MIPGWRTLTLQRLTEKDKRATSIIVISFPLNPSRLECVFLYQRHVDVCTLIELRCPGIQVPCIDGRPDVMTDPLRLCGEVAPAGNVCSLGTGRGLHAGVHGNARPETEGQAARATGGRTPHTSPGWPLHCATRSSERTHILRAYIRWCREAHMVG